MNYLRKLGRAQEVNRLQAQQELQNCALLCAYAFGQPDGWYMIADGNINGFPSDYAMIHGNVGDIECHKIKAIFAINKSEIDQYAGEIEDIRKAVAEAYRMVEPPAVSVFTPEEIEHARRAVRDALEAAAPEDTEGWLRGLCKGVSDLSMCDWTATLAAICRV